MSAPEAGAHPGRSLAVAALASVCAVSLVAAAYFPGQMSTDSFVQLGEARFGPITDLHPPLMSWVWRWLDRIYAGPALMLLGQCLLLAACTTLLARRGRSLVASAALPLLLVSVPSVFAMAGTIWKDVPFAALCLLSIALLAQDDWPVARRVGLALPALVLAVSLRHNGMAATVPIAFWVGHVLTPGRARAFRWASGLAVVGALWVSTSLVSAALREVPPRFPATLQLRLHDLAAIEAATQRAVVASEYVAQHPQCTGAPLTSAYTIDPGNVAFVVFAPAAPCPPTEDPAQIEAVERSWRAAVMASPQAWLAHRWQLWRTLIGAREGGVYYPFHTGVDPNGLGVEFAPAGFTRPLREGLIQVKDSWWFRGWVWLIVASALIAYGWRAREPMAVVTGASAWLYALAYLPTAPVPDFRLLWWVVLGPAAVSLAALLRSKRA